MRSIVVGLCVVTLVACGGAVAGSATDSGAGSSSVAAGTGGTTGFGGGGSGGECAYTMDSATLRVDRPEGVTLDCTTVPGFSPTMDAGPPPNVDGVVMSVTPTSFTVNTCPPPADCSALTVNTFYVDATKVDGVALTQAISEGSFVHVEYSIKRFFACTVSIEVTSLPTFAGLPNPNGGARTILLALVDGGGPFPSSTYTVTHRKLDCPGLDAGRSCNGGTDVGPHAFSLAPNDGTRPAVELRMGETKEIDLQPPGALGTVVAHNLRSYQTQICDDYWNYSYYLVGRPPTG